jgi:Zn-dependent M28 family amino/carboxypeptidase
MLPASRRTARRFGVALLAFAAACASGRSTGAAQSLPELDGERLLADVRLLSADSLQGRATGTPGGLKARAHVVAAFERARLTPFAGGFERPFTTTARGSSPPVRGANVVGYLRGTERPDRYLVVTAHYDHLGVRDGQVFNGADDNASGTAALLALAEYFVDNPPRHSIIFAALDAEEIGLQGARAFVETPPVDRAALALNVNMDMVSHSARGELYAAGTHHTPALRPIVERVAARAPVKLLIGHDSPSLPATDDWTTQSDHGAFHAARIPFVYFGVEDHPDYHKPSDDFGTITPAFYVAAARTIADFVAEADRTLAARGPGRS